MTFTPDLATVVTAIVTALILFGWSFNIFALWCVWARHGFKVPQFFSQLTKLVMANNPDRAIKLCNTAITNGQHHRIAVAAKKLLLAHKRKEGAEGIDRAYNEAATDLATFNVDKRVGLHVLGNGLLSCSTVALLVWATTETWQAVVLVVAFVGGRVLSEMAEWKANQVRVRMKMQTDEELVKLCNLLAKNAKAAS